MIKIYTVDHNNFDKLNGDSFTIKLPKYIDNEKRYLNKINITGINKNTIGKYEIIANLYFKDKDLYIKICDYNDLCFNKEKKSLKLYFCQDIYLIFNINCFIKKENMPFLSTDSLFIDQKLNCEKELSTNDNESLYIKDTIEKIEFHYIIDNNIPYHQFDFETYKSNTNTILMNSKGQLTSMNKCTLTDLDKILLYDENKIITDLKEIKLINNLNKTKIDYELFIRLGENLENNKFTFIVYVINEKIKKYKLSGKTYKINIYTSSKNEVIKDLKWIDSFIIENDECINTFKKDSCNIFINDNIDEFNNIFKNITKNELNVINILHTFFLIIYEDNFKFEEICEYF